MDEKYMAALNRQKVERTCGIAMVYAYPERYCVVRMDGMKIYFSPEFGKEQWPIALCARE